MNNFFAVPDKGKNYQQYMVYVLTIIWSVVTGAIVSIGFLFFPELWTRWLTFVCVSIFIAAFNLSLNRLGHTRLASWSLTIMIWLYITIPCYSAGGIAAPGILTQMSVILTAGFLLGWRGGLAIGLLTICTDLGLAYMEVTGHLPSPSVVHNPITRWIGTIIPFATILAMQYYATNHLRSGLIALQQEILKREHAEKIKDQTLYNLKERVKELKTLYRVSRILQDVDASAEKLFPEIVEAIPGGWRFPDTAAARLHIATKQYATNNYEPSEHNQMAEMTTTKGTRVAIEVVYLQAMPESDEGPFLQEERYLINMLVEMLKIDLERRERRAELKDYKYALDIASSVSISEVNGSFSFVNENFCKACKYTPDELLGKQHTIIASGYHSPEYFIEMGNAMQDGKPFRGEFCNKAKDGTLFWVDTSIVPLLDDNGKVYQYLSINHDITARREADLKLRQNDIKNRALIENISEAIVLIDENENIIFQSPAVTRITGYLPEESYGEKSFDYIHPEEVNAFKAFLQRVRNTPEKPLQAQFRIIHKDGHTIWLEGTLANMLHNESIKGIVVNYRDVTERKEAEEEIKQSKERYKSIITVSNTGAWEYHLDTNAVWYSSEYFSMLGLDHPHDGWDKSMETIWVDRLHPDDRDSSIALFNQFLKGGSDGLYENYFRMRHEDGHWIWIWSRARKLQDANGNLTNITLGTHIDITERINAEEKVKQSEQLLRKITSLVPSNTYMFELDESGYSNILFMNRGTDRFNHSYDLDSLGDNHEMIREIIHEDDKAKFNEAMKRAYQTQSMISFQYRIVANETVRWRWMQALPEKDDQGKVVWYGVTSDVTPIVEYIVSIEQVIFDIGHIIRRPISSMKGMTRLIVDSDLSEKETKEISKKLHNISEEMDKFILELNLVYHQKRQNTKLNIDISSLIDKRSSLFN